MMYYGHPVLGLSSYDFGYLSTQPGNIWEPFGTLPILELVEFMDQTLSAGDHLWDEQPGVE